jgi:hypothetical protein
MKILAVDGVPVRRKREPEPDSVSADRKIQISKAAEEEVTHCITVSRPINGISINGDEYLLGERGKPLAFETMKDPIRFFRDRNFTITDLLNFDFCFEEERGYGA